MKTDGEKLKHTSWEPSPKVRICSILTPQPFLPDCEETHASKADDIVARARRDGARALTLDFLFPPSLLRFLFFTADDQPYA